MDISIDLETEVIVIESDSDDDVMIVDNERNDNNSNDINIQSECNQDEIMIEKKPIFFNKNHLNMVDGSINSSIYVGDSSKIDYKIDTDLRGNYRTLKINVENLNIRKFLIPDETINKLVNIIKDMKDVKLQFGVEAEFVKENVIKSWRISNSAVPYRNKFLIKGIRLLNEKIIVRNELGSNWTIKRIL